MFFFSSRRRHTRWNCDWSSDVCSSDLAVTRPSNLVVVENIIRQETKGFEQPIDARFDMLEGGQYTIDVPAAQLPSAKRSEEHTSELQSQFHLVCRLLLEKKKKNKYKHV